MKYKTQRAIIEAQLRREKEISRNWCLSQYISRLGAYICDMKKEGWEFVPSRREYTKKNWDYVYKLVKAPKA